VNFALAASQRYGAIYCHIWYGAIYLPYNTTDTSCGRKLENELNMCISSASQFVTSWKTKDKQGSIQFEPSVGAIVINLPGRYYIYCQMYYYNEKEHLMAHQTTINDKVVLESVAGITNESRSKQFTKQHGGVFRLDRNDRIRVKVPFSHHSYSFDKTTSYFGAFRIGP